MKNRFKSSFNIFTLFALLASLLGSAVFATPAYAAGIVVNSNADTIADDGTCTLREAITNANGDSQLYTSAGECAMGAETDTITFAANHTITLDGNQLPAVTSTIIINGNGVTNTIIQASTCDPVTLPGGCTPVEYRVFEVSSTGDLTVDKITVRHGRCDNSCESTIPYGGAGILNIGTLTVTNSAFSSNSASHGGGVYNTGVQTVTNSSFAGNLAKNDNVGVFFGIGAGGGLYNTGNLKMTSCSFSNNFSETLDADPFSGGFGGGIANEGALTLENCSFSDNSVNNLGLGGAIYNFYNHTMNITGGTFTTNYAFEGGGIHNEGTSNIADSTFSNNEGLARGGGIRNGSNLTVTGSIFTDNKSSDGGGISNYYGTTVVANSTFANNTAGDGGGIYNRYFLIVTNSTFSGNSASSSIGGVYSVYSGYASLKNSIIANNIGGNCSEVYAYNRNLSTDDTCLGAIEATSADINLGPLADNGGPTKTLALLPGSIAIDEGNNDICAAAIGVPNYGADGVDQRGVTRPHDGLCDIGAFEGEPGVATFSDVPSNHWAYTYIERLYNAGITGGCSASPLMYCPDATVTRAQMAIFILRGIDGSTYTPPAATGTVFADVPIGSFAADWIEQLAVEGITSGCGNGNYCPDATITRAQMAIFLLRGEHGSIYAPPTATGTVFGDVPLGSFAVDWIEQLALEAITSGCGGGNYCPDNSVTRAEMAVFLVRAFGLP